MASTNSAKTLSDVLASLSVTMSDFQTESAKVEADFFALVDGLRGKVSVASPVGDTAAVQNQVSSLAQPQLEAGGKQDKLSDEVEQLREIVDQQTRLFEALINSKENVTRDDASNEKENSTEDEVLNDVFAQFKALSGAGTR